MMKSSGPTHKQTEGHAPVWGSELLQNLLYYMGG
jgi:hypothetical protein